MACDTWRGQTDAYLDGELSHAEAAKVVAHHRECASCAAEALERVQMKRAVAVAGKRYEASAELRARIARSVAAKPRRQNAWPWRAMLVAAASVLIAAVAINLYVGRESSRRRIYSELADLHVSTLASATPVDVISTDRHTVKPWFAGKLPFTFNLPELQGTDFVLLGGRVTYLGQRPGAHLIYQIRKHEVSVFIVQDLGGETSLAAGPVNALSFNVESWSQNGLQYFVIGDVGANDIQALSKLLRNAA